MKNPTINPKVILNQYTGWVSIHRSILTWEWYDDFNTFRLFVYLILRVNHENGDWRGISIKRGACITSYKKLSQETGLSVMKVRTSLNKLILTHEITLETTSQYSVITVNNYNEFQKNNTQDNKPITNEQQTDNKRITTNNNNNNNNNKNKYLSDFEKVWKIYKHKIKKKSSKEKYISIIGKDEKLVDIIYESIKKHNDTVWLNKEKKFIPHFITWLNNERWEDEVEVEEKPSDDSGTDLIFEAKKRQWFEDNNLTEEELGQLAEKTLKKQ